MTATHGFMVFDQLHGINSAFRPQPQMAEGHTVPDDGLTWRIRLHPGLRPGLRFNFAAVHDAVAPLGFWKSEAACRRTITGLIPADLSLFWNVRPAWPDREGKHR